LYYFTGIRRAFSKRYSKIHLYQSFISKGTGGGGVGIFEKSKG
jgi:hypothetical protein